MYDIEKSRYTRAVAARSLPLVESCAPLARPTLSAAEAEDLERLFKALADRHRVRILNLLAHAGEDGVCVCDFVPSLGLAQPTVSYHLKQLMDAGLLERLRRGSYIHYSISHGVLDRISGLLS